MQSDQGHSEVQHQLLITLVHGTWPQGFFRTFFWTPRRRHPSPLWYEDGSPFLARLSTELRDISHKMRRLLWTGENSIRIRDETAQALAEHLSAEHAEHPQATQLVIAHSHGGNIALRALHHLKQRDASGADAANPLTVTLATPFIEVHQADFGRRSHHIRNALITAIVALPIFLPLLFILRSAGDASAVNSSPSYWSGLIIGIVVSFFIAGPLRRWWHSGRVVTRQNQLDALRDATQQNELMFPQRLLVIRAIDDEASLALALGAILNYGTARFIVLLLFLYLLLSVSFSLVSLILVTVVGSAFVSPLLIFSIVAASVLTIALFGILMISRSVHGRELAKSPLECQINTQSTPDAVGLSKIVTLVRRTYVKSLRHGIYDHEDCAKVISDWVRFRLGGTGGTACASSQPTP